MIVFSAVIFFGSLIGIVMLFGIKYWELRTDRVMAPVARGRADEHALRIKEWLEHTRFHAEKLPPAFMRLARLTVHEAALGVALLARKLEEGAHTIADYASHKHRFERRESTNEFLKKMNDHKNGTTEEEQDRLS